MKTKVVNVHKEPCDVCIMRPSILANRFEIGKDGTREEVIAKHKEYMYQRIEHDTEFMLAIFALQGKRIGCCCAPLPCHGDNYVEFLEGEWA